MPLAPQAYAPTGSFPVRPVTLLPMLSAVSGSRVIARRLTVLEGLAELI